MRLYQQATSSNPAVKACDHLLNEYIRSALDKVDWQHVARSAQNDTPLYIIPTVVHVVHDYGAELLDDTVVNNLMLSINNYFSKNIADTALIIDKFRPIAANTRIAFRLAHLDPSGAPTKGIDHIRSYLTSNANDQSKLNGWPQDRYLNIWLVRNSIFINAVGGFAYYPAVAQTVPYYDGLLTSSAYFDMVVPAVVLSAQYLDLKWMCYDNGNPLACVDGDGIPDTPPCNYLNNCQHLYDTLCDTPNIQNIMGSGCQLMFTNGQATVMGTVLAQSVASRNNLVSAGNRLATGMDTPTPDLPPTPEFSVEKGRVSSGIPVSGRTYFYCANDMNVRFGFVNRSWNDTVTALHWHFSNAASIADTVYSLGQNEVIYNSFTQPGWVTVSLTATGNNSGSTTLVDSQAVYAADGNNPIVENPNVLPIHVMEFNPGQTDDWPVFNYYKNNFKWQLNNVSGYFDNTCMEYLGFDSRLFPSNMTGSPAGDYDDFFSPAYDLSAMTNGYCNINFMSAGAYAANSLVDIHDTLELSYSIDCGRTWVSLYKLGGTELDNNGVLPIAYAPLWAGEWKLNSVELPVAARTSKTFFRFRYSPGANADGFSTGNNFYLDRISISNFPTGINTLLHNEHDVVLVPNPAKGDSYALISGVDNDLVELSVLDASGRTIYSTGERLHDKVGKIHIPSFHFRPGLYFVTVLRQNEVTTRKLLVYE